MKRISLALIVALFTTPAWAINPGDTIHPELVCADAPALETLIAKPADQVREFRRALRLSFRCEEMGGKTPGVLGKHLKDDTVTDLEGNRFHVEIWSIKLTPENGTPTEEFFTLISFKLEPESKPSVVWPSEL